MKAIEFSSSMDANHSLTVPADIASRIPQDQPIRVLVLIDDAESERNWELLTASEFGLGYSESDSIYDKLSGR